jgi:hypothetical protein
MTNKKLKQRDAMKTATAIEAIAVCKYFMGARGLFDIKRQAMCGPAWGIAA